MAKQKKEELKEEVAPVIEQKEESKPKIANIGVEFNQEGLNSLRDKLNEVIDFLNK